MSNFQERMLLCRQKLQKTQDEAAKESGFNYRSYCRWERGEAEPNLSTLIKLADYFQVSLDYLVGRTDVWEVAR